MCGVVVSLRDEDAGACPFDYAQGLREAPAAMAHRLSPNLENACHIVLLINIVGTYTYTHTFWEHRVARPPTVAPRAVTMRGHGTRIPEHRRIA